MTKNKENANKNNRKQQQRKTQTPIINDKNRDISAEMTKKIDNTNVLNPANPFQPQKVAESPQKDIRGTILQSDSAVKEK